MSKKKNRPAKQMRTAKITPSKPKSIEIAEIEPGVWMTRGAINRYAAKNKAQKK